MKYVISLVLCLLCVCSALPQSRKGRNSSTVRREQAEVKEKMGQTQKQIDENKRNTRTKLNELHALNAQISTTNQNIAEIKRSVHELNIREIKLNDSIALLEKNLSRLQEEYSQSLVNNRRRRQSMTEVGLIFSSESFNMAFRRNSYLQQLKRQLEDKSVKLRSVQAELNTKRDELTRLKDKQQKLLASLSAENAKLAEQKAQTQSLVNDLNKERETLSQVMREQQALSNKLDAELNRIIEEERLAEERRGAEERRRAEEKRKADQKKALSDKQKAKDNKNAETANNTPSSAKPKALSGSFASNKGKLLFPVTGKYRIVGKFGIEKHDDLPYVQTQNTGIDIEATPGANARAVYDGEVSSIFYLDGFQNIVMVRHGDYLTVYTNIDRLSVRKGDKVKAGQQLGHININKSDNNRAVMHFEVRREKQQLNPLEWVSR